MVALAPRLAIIALAVVVGGCQSALNWGGGEPRRKPPVSVSATGMYTVVAGDTLYGIAWRHGLDHRELARWNGLGSGGLIIPGQRIKLTRPTSSASDVKKPGTSKPVSTPPATSPPPAWFWPVPGRVVAEFNTGETPRTGMLISGTVGDPVRSAAGGKVVYAGSGLIGYGQLIIVKHNESFLSAYGHNTELLVGEGDLVSKGQVIAKIGLGPEQQPVLHFEIRQNGKPVNPRRLMPVR